MNKTAFNLADEPWIRVMLQDCSVREVSLTEALENAHCYRGLAGEMEVQNVAMLRMLIALVHTVFTRVDLDGNHSPVEEDQEALDRWASLMRAGQFPQKPLREYLEKWHDRFWLCDDDHPFYQVPGADNGTQNTAAKLNGEVSESKNKTRLFSFLTAEGRRDMSLAEGARWLIFINGFDDCAAKQKSEGSRPMTVGWLGKLGLVTAVGSSLFETIMLNMCMMNWEGHIWDEDDRPVWELPEPCGEERRTIPMPSDLASLFTLQSRRVLLISEGQRITGYKILGGDAFSERNALNEPMTLWKHIEYKKEKISYFAPCRHERARQIWREFGTLVNTGEYEKRPGVVDWCGKLQDYGLIAAKRMITFRIACVQYDSKSSSITDAFSDAISFHANLLTETGREWVREINHQLELIGQAAGEVGDLAANLGRACGQRNNEFCNASEKAKEQFYLSVDLPFRDWLLELDPEQDTDERMKKTESWQKRAKGIAMALGRQLIEEKGDVAFVGRMVKENKKERHYSSPEAYRWFRYHLGNIYPYIEGGDEQHG